MAVLSVQLRCNSPKGCKTQELSNRVQWPSKGTERGSMACPKQVPRARNIRIGPQNNGAFNARLRLRRTTTRSWCSLLPMIRRRFSRLCCTRRTLVKKCSPSRGTRRILFSNQVLYTFATTGRESHPESSAPVAHLREMCHDKL